MTYAITGASGQLGRLAADELLTRVPAGDVVLLTRDPAKLADYTARGVDVRAGDFADAAGLERSLAGVEQLLLISTDAVGKRLTEQVAAIGAAEAAGVRRVLYTSVPRPDADNPALVVADHAGTEAALRDGGLAWTMLRNNLYADMQVAELARAGDTGTLVTNAGDGAVAYVTPADCAAAAAAALLDDGLAGRALDITGPAALTAADRAELAARRSGRLVEVTRVDDKEFAAGLTGAGLPEEVAALITSFGAAARAGWLADVTTAVPDLLGRPAMPLSDLLA